MTTHYALLDSGDFQKLEDVGPYRVIRQATQAFWSKNLQQDDWSKAHGIHVRTRSGGGYWKFSGDPPPSWQVDHGGFRFKIKPTPFGHLGLFAEQEDQWRWIEASVPQAPIEVLNLFGYTGGSTMAALSAGARVTHVDASKGAVTWARENAALNDLSKAPVRWIVEDVCRYVRREQKRNRRYQGLILDPPTFGRGAAGQQWRIERDLVPLLTELAALTDPLLFAVLSCHTPGYSPLGLAHVLAHAFKLPLDDVACGEMTITHRGHKTVLPSGTFARWTNAG